jgi:uncharacterized SAM-binding protein YcdF (DUF218 family)
MTFALSKLLWALVQPGNLLLILLVCGSVGLLAKRRRLGTALVASSAAGFLAIALLPIGQWLLIPLENRFPPVEEVPERIDGMVVLGGSLDAEVSMSRRQAALREAAERLTGAIELARARPNARLIFSGGIGRLTGEASEAVAVEQFWRAQGVPSARVTFERESRNTYENAGLSKRVADPQVGERWLLVTSAAHMPRAVGVFRAIGWPVIAYPVDFRTTGRLELRELVDGWLQLDFSERLIELDQAARSWIGLVTYRLMGRTDALLPAP